MLWFSFTRRFKRLHLLGQHCQLKHPFKKINLKSKFERIEELIVLGIGEGVKEVEGVSKTYIENATQNF